MLAGCTNQQYEERKVTVAKLQDKLFKDCLILTAKIERKGDDDVSDIVDSCASKAWVTADNMVKRE